MTKSRPHIVSFVANKVEGDSRVLKTAQAAINHGYDATVIGVGSAFEVVRKEIEGIPVVLLPNSSARLRKLNLWGVSPDNRDIGLLIGGYLRDLIPVIMELEPDLIHSHDMNGLKLGAMSRTAFLSTGVRVPWVHDLHELVYGLRGEQAEAYMPTCLEWEREFLHTADHLLTVSDPLSEKIARRYRLEEAPTVVYNTPYRADFSNEGADLRSALGLAADTKLVTFVGGANKLRGCEVIVEAVSRLPDVHLAFVSQGPYVDGLVARADELGMGDRFHTHPMVPSRQVTSFIRTGDIGIHGLIKYPNGEVAMPNKLFEYMHAGLPVVSSDVAAMKEFVETNDIGSVFEAQDPDSCAAAITATFENLPRFKANLTEALCERYSWEDQERKLIGIYSRLIAEQRPLQPGERDQAVREMKAERLFYETSMSRALSEVSVVLLKQMEADSNRRHDTCLLRTM